MPAILRKSYTKNDRLQQILLRLSAVNMAWHVAVLFAHKGDINDGQNTGTAVQQIEGGVISVWQCLGDG